MKQTNPILYLQKKWYFKITTAGSNTKISADPNIA